MKQISVGDVTYLIWAHEDLGKRLLLLRRYEPAETRAFHRLVRGDDVCVDAGGNIGYYSLNLGKLCKNGGHVYVFEPVLLNALLIELAVELNALHNITVVRAALSDSHGSVRLAIPDVDRAYSYIARQGHAGANRGQQIAQCTTLDAFVAEHRIEKVDIVKIDVEGAERLVLEGARGVLSNGKGRPRVVMAELVNAFLRRFGSSVSEAIEYMRGFGYSPYYALRNGHLAMYTDEYVDRVFNVFFVRPS